MAFQATFFHNYTGQLGKDIFNIADINGFNVYEGWYQGNMESIGWFIDSLKGYSPHHPIMLSEFGAGADPRIHTQEPTIFDFSSEYQPLYYAPYLNAPASRPWMIGLSAWVFADFQRDGRKDAVPNVNSKGIVTTDRKKKDVFYYIKSRWSDVPFVYLAGKQSTQRVALSPSQVTVKAFSNQPTITLVHNGVNKGQKEVVDGVAEWSLTMEEGENKLMATSKKLRLLDTLNLSYDYILNGDQVEIPSGGLHLNIGETRTQFTDDEGHVWIATPRYEKDKLGYVGGRPYVKDYEPDHAFYETRLGVPNNFIGTDLDPVYQTFVEGIKEFRVHVQNGTYEVTLLISEPFEDKKNELSDAEKAWGEQNQEAIGARSFSIQINGKELGEVNLAKHGINRPLTITESVRVKNHALVVTFESKASNALLNGLIIRQ